MPILKCHHRTGKVLFAAFSYSQEAEDAEKTLRISEALEIPQISQLQLYDSNGEKLKCFPIFLVNAMRTLLPHKRIHCGYTPFFLTIVPYMWMVLILLKILAL